MVKQKQSKKSHKTQKLLLPIIAIVICVVAILVIIGFKLCQSQQVNYTIAYYTGNNLYEIKARKSTILIEKKDVVQCIKAPCNPIHVSSHTIAYKDDYRKLFERLSSNDSTEITIHGDVASSDLPTNVTAADIDIIDQIITQAK